MFHKSPPLESYLHRSCPLPLPEVAQLRLWLGSALDWRSCLLPLLLRGQLLIPAPFPNFRHFSTNFRRFFASFRRFSANFLWSVGVGSPYGAQITPAAYQQLIFPLPSAVPVMFLHHFSGGALSFPTLSFLTACWVPPVLVFSPPGFLLNCRPSACSQLLYSGGHFAQLRTCGCGRPP